MKNRLDKWKKEEDFPILFKHPMNPIVEQLINEKPLKNDKITNTEFTKLAREFVFDLQEGIPIFHVIAPILDTTTFHINYEHFADILFSGEVQEIEKEVINTLAMAVIFDVPVYPNHEMVEFELSRYYQKLLIDGFTAPDEKGEDVRLMPVNSKNIEEFKIENISDIDLTRFWSPTDMALMKNSIKTELSKLSNAQKVLTYLELAISELEELLKNANRNENDLQKCLTKNPILFGLDYSNVIPKYKLGAEYEVDYALERYSGMIDLMEIESSGLPLFTKTGNPTSYLVHAEQQVIDWIDWVEKFGPYARSKMAGMLSPKGFVVIGRDSSLNEKNRASLIRRNNAFNGLITVLTYDDLLKKSRTLLRTLKNEDS